MPNDQSYGDNVCLIQAFKEQCSNLWPLCQRGDSELTDLFNTIIHDSPPILSTKNKTVLNSVIDADHILHHVASGGYGAVFLFYNYIFKVVPYPRATPSEFLIPAQLHAMIEKDLKLQVLHTFFIRPINCTYVPDLKVLWIGISKILMLFHMLHLAMTGSQNIKQDYDNSRITDLVVTSSEAKTITKLIGDAIGVYLNVGSKHAHLYRFLHRTFHNQKLQAVPSYIMVMPKALLSGNLLQKTQKTLATLLVFQTLVFYALLVPRYPMFVHGDLKLDNILLFESERDKFVFEFAGTTYTFPVRYVWQISDFDLATLQPLTSGVGWQQDLHYFFHTIAHYKNIVLPSSLKTNPFCTDKCKNWVIPESSFTIDQLTALIIKVYAKWGASR